MGSQTLLASVTRISDLDRGDFRLHKLARSDWAGGDYVAATVTGAPSSLYRVELTNGRIVEVMEGARVIGALGVRAATLEATGDWRAIGDDGSMHSLTPAGLFGKALSVAPWLGQLMSLQYEGHVVRGEAKLTMADFVAPAPARRFTTPTVLLIGTSMSAGKTTTGRIIVNALKRRGLTVAGAKLTGAGRYRDVLSFQDAGADAILDFVDVGLPSTVVPAREFDPALALMLDRIAGFEADVLVAEAGASPLEPYNGDAVVRALADNIRLTVLCASDPYAVLGVQTAFGLEPDIVTGPAANTDAGIELIDKLTNLKAMNMLRRQSVAELEAILARLL